MAKQTAGTAVPFKAPTSKDELLAWLKHKSAIGKAVTTEQQMKLQLSFVLGYHWITWDDQVRAYVRPRIDTTDPNVPIRLTANKITAMGERLIAKLTRQAPEPECRPVSDDDDDTGAAQVGTRVMGSELNRLNWPAWLQQFLFSPFTTGFAYAHVYWDPDDGDKIEGASDDDGDDDDLFVGNAKLDIVPAFELRVDPSSHFIDVDAKWCERVTTMSTEAVWEKWGIELKGGGRRSLAREVMALGNSTTAEPAHNDWVTVHQFWMLPCRAAPAGMVVTWANDQIIENKQSFPYKHGKLPFVQMNWLPPLEGMREGRTIVTDMIPIQVDYNDTLSRMATIRRTQVPKLLAAAGSIDEQRIGTRVDVLKYNPVGQPPQWIEPNSAWTSAFMLGMERAEADMQDRAGVNDATAGKSGASAPAASIMALQEMDDSKLAITATELAKFIQGVGWQILMLCRQYWAEERTVRVWSDDDVLQAYRYLGSDIDEQLDVHVSAESALPKSKAARAQLFLELAARYPQLIQPQDLIRLLDVPGVDFLTRSVDVDTRKQYRENGLMLQGQDCVVQAFDNHAEHLSVINDFRKSREYELLPTEMQARFDAHAAVHEMLVLKQLGIVIPPGDYEPMAGQQAQQASAGPAGGSQLGVTSPFLLDPLQGQPGDPMHPQGLAQAAGIGGTGNPGRVPNTTVDNQAAYQGN